jgi:hypothetical protein
MYVFRFAEEKGSNLCTEGIEICIRFGAYFIEITLMSLLQYWDISGLEKSKEGGKRKVEWCGISGKFNRLHSSRGGCTFTRISTRDTLDHCAIHTAFYFGYTYSIVLTMTWD